MHCTNCGAELPEGSVFCTNCGAQMAEPEPMTFCTNCGSSIPASAANCPVCGQELISPTPAKKGLDLKNLDIKKLAPIIGIAVVAILAVVLLISLFGGGTSPIEGLMNVLDKGNFTVAISMDGEKISMKVDLDLKKKEITAYGKASGMEIGIYDEKFFMYNEDYGYGEVTDISDYMDEIFEALENAEDANWEDIIDLLKDTAGIDLEDYIDIKEFEKCMKTFAKNLSSKSWLKENAGYSTESKDGVKLHIYEPDLYKLALASLQTFEKAFEDEDIYEETIDSLKDSRDELKDMKLKLELGVKGKYLVEGSVKVSGGRVKLSIEDIGSTKINTKHLEDILDEID